MRQLINHMECGILALQLVLSSFYPLVLPITDVGCDRLEVSWGVILFKHLSDMFRHSFNISSTAGDFLLVGTLVVVSLSVS